MSRGLGWIQRAALQFLSDANGWSHDTREVVSHVFGLDWIEHDSPQRRSTSRALKGLIDRGLIFERGPGLYSTQPGRWVTEEEVMQELLYDPEYERIRRESDAVLAICYTSLERLGLL